MKRFFLFRSNIKNLEYYHEYKDLETFEKLCHDFYMLFPIEMIRKNLVDEVVIYRLSDKNIPPIIFNINGKLYIQKWVRSFSDIVLFKEYENPYISFWRGGFKEYDAATLIDPEFFGKKLYLGASKRVTPTFGGLYDNILVEDDKHLNISNSIPFYKTVNPNIFKPLNLDIEYDLCWICNCSQITQKGQEWFIEKISKSNKMRRLKIIHIGNNPEVGKKLCDKYGVTNISFFGWKTREVVNHILNQSKFGIVTSNENDGCPRVSTEILGSSCPLLIRDKTKLLSYYKKYGVVEYSEDIDIIMKALDNYKHYKEELINNFNHFSFGNICNKNFELWGI